MDFEKMTVSELREVAKEKKLKNVSSMKKQDIIDELKKLEDKTPGEKSDVVEKTFGGQSKSKNVRVKSKAENATSEKADGNPKNGQVKSDSADKEQKAVQAKPDSVSNNQKAEQTKSGSAAGKQKETPVKAEIPAREKKAAKSNADSSAKEQKAEQRKADSSAQEQKAEQSKAGIVAKEQKAEPTKADNTAGEQTAEQGNTDGTAVEQTAEAVKTANLINRKNDYNTDKNGKKSVKNIDITVETQMIERAEREDSIKNENDENRSARSEAVSELMRAADELNQKSRNRNFGYGTEAGGTVRETENAGYSVKDNSGDNQKQNDNGQRQQNDGRNTFKNGYNKNGKFGDQNRNRGDQNRYYGDQNRYQNNSKNQQTQENSGMNADAAVHNAENVTQSNEGTAQKTFDKNQNANMVKRNNATPNSEEALDIQNTVNPETSSMDSKETKSGILEIMPDGFGFIRCDNFLPGENDVYVSPAQIRRMNLKTGDFITGNTKVKSQGEKFSALLYVKSINGLHPSEALYRPRFEDLTPIFPYERLHLETPGCSPAMRIVDILSPIGKGQRGMIVSQPKAGKTTLLKEIAKAIKINNPEMHLIILLIDERPEEVTDMKESISGDNVEVIYSTFDELPENHKRVSEMVIGRAKRLVEHKKDVVILLDSITRLARAYNLTVAPSGRTLSGGLDPAALHMPKKFFGSARCMREGGSLTILATALVETGSRMDDVVFEEFKGTGNMELVLDRNLSEKRVFPAIDLPKSSTRRDDLLLSQEEIEANEIIRHAFNSSKSGDAVEKIINMFAHTKDNREFVQMVKKMRF